MTIIKKFLAVVAVLGIALTICGCSAISGKSDSKTLKILSGSENKELKIAGGVGEHGRNCFYVDAGEDTFLVDCGKMGGSDDPFPKLERSDIRRVKYVFLTHSHADHTGALPWLFKNGFDGTIIASSQTLEQLTVPLNNTVPLEKIRTDNYGKIGGITFEYGRAGHCAGSVWYHFFVDNKSILFSGDYTENSAVYQCDKIRERKADIAVIDCAYGNDENVLSVLLIKRQISRRVMEYRFFVKVILNHLWYEIINALIIGNSVSGRVYNCDIARAVCLH